MESVALELVVGIAKLSPVFAILILWLYSTLKSLKEKEKEIAELQEYIRGNEKENMKVFQQVSETLLNITNDTTNSNANVTREFSSLKEYIKDKLK